MIDGSLERRQARRLAEEKIVMSTSNTAVIFLQDHDAHGVVGADDPAHGQKGLLCSACAARCSVPREMWDSESVLVSWEAENALRRAKEREVEKTVLEALRGQQQAAMPEVRFTAKYGRRDEDDPI